VPIVRILLRFGITWREVSELTKRVYVEVAQQDYAERRRPVNTSRLAVMTGLTRKEVRRIRDLEDRIPSALREYEQAQAAGKQPHCE